MNIVVGVKVVPDTAAQVRVENGRVTWGDAPLVLNPWDEFAVEAALQAKEKFGGQVTVISMGDENALEALRRALAMGCQQAYRIYEESLVQAVKNRFATKQRYMAPNLKALGAGLDLAKELA